MNAADPMRVYIRTLPNGLTVYLSENPDQPRIAARVVVRAGAAQEPREATGLAHYLEHMLANKGTRRLGTLDYAAEEPHLARIRDLYDALREAQEPLQRQEIRDQIRAEDAAASRYAISNELKQVTGLLGGRGFNAFTSHDQTAYVVDIPSNRLEHWAALEADRFLHPVWRAFPTEVETICEEKNRSLDDPARRLNAALSAALWPDHPYGAEVLGELAHLERPSISRMEAYFRDWYAPGNLAVVLAGDLDAESAFAVIERRFGALPARPVPASPIRALAPLVGERRVEIAHPGQEEIQIGWRAVPYGHPDRDALTVMDMVLDNRVTGLLNQNLVLPQRVRAAGSFPRFMRESGAITLWGRPRGGQDLAAVEALLLEQVAVLQEGAFAEEDLEAIRLHYAVGYARGIEENATRAGLLMQSFLFEEPWEGPWAALRRLQAVTRERIIEVARRYLGPDRVVALRREGDAAHAQPAAEPRAGRELNPGARSAFSAEVLGMPAPPVGLQTLAPSRDYTLEERGSNLFICVPNPCNDLAQLSLRFPTGRAADRAVGHALGLWQRSGSPGVPAADAQRALYRIGASLQVGWGRWTVDVKLHCPADALPAAWALVRARLAEPALEPDQFARYKEDTLAKRRESRRDKGALVKALQQLALYGPEGSTYQGLALTDAEVAALSADAVAALPPRLLGLPVSASHVGPLSIDEIAALVAPPDAAAPEPPPQRYRRPAGTEIWLLHHPSVQAAVAVLAPDEPFGSGGSPETAPLQRLYEEYLGGSAGLIFQEVRESRAMAYAAHGGYSFGWRKGDDNLLWASVGTQAEKVPDAVALLLRLLRAPPEPERFARARESVLEQLRAQRITFRGVGPAVEGWRWKGFDGDPRRAWLDAVGRAALPDLAALAARLAGLPATVAIVGDLDRIDARALADLAPVRVVGPAEVMVYG